VILVIDATVTGPDGVLTGSVAVTVNAPAPEQAPPAAPAAQPRADPGDLENRRLQQRSQALRWSGR
jgi:hypothetical protein